MINDRRTVLIFATLWFALAVSQYVESFHGCDDRSPLTLVYWAALLAAMTAPLMLIARNTTRGGIHGHEPQTLLPWVLSVFVPAFLALRLIQVCAPQ